MTTPNKLLAGGIAGLLVSIVGLALQNDSPYVKLGAVLQWGGTACIVLMMALAIRGAIADGRTRSAGNIDPEDPERYDDHGRPI